MQAFAPAPIPGDAPEWFKTWARQHNDAIRKAANTANDSIQLRVLTAAPSKPQDGAQYNADGTNWNPGSGAGTYRYNASSGTYTFLG